MIGQKFPPTPQQAAVIGAPMEPMLVVAGAGAGKTETMAARVVWLVANGFVRPEQVLGLTFTRKAASELGLRIRDRLGALARSPKFRKVAAPEVLRSLDIIAPTALTYDAYAGELVRQYGLLLPTEPMSTVLDGASQWFHAWEIAQNVSKLDVDMPPMTLAKTLLKLNDALDSELAEVSDAVAETTAFLHNLANIPKGPRQKNEWHSGLKPTVEAQQKRLALLKLVDALRTRMADENSTTFAMQMSKAARLALTVPEVSESERRRFKVVMLDEYQDTSHAQRLLLKKVFAGSCVTAVGDPMQAIYSWRGATAENLSRFVTDYPKDNGEPADTRQLTISWRNPKSVLDLANLVSQRAFLGRPRTVEALTAGPKAGDGEVRLAAFPTGDEEIAYISDYMAAAYEKAEVSGENLSAAILVRSNKQIPPIMEALAERGIPAISMGTLGFLSLPEVLDVRSVMSVVADPTANSDMLRILTSPRVNLGAADIKALEKRADRLVWADKSEAEEAPVDSEETSPLVTLGEKLDALVPSADSVSGIASLADAVADPGIRYKDGTAVARGSEEDNGPLVSEVDYAQYSPEGMRRIVELGAILRKLRKYSLSKPLPEFVADIEEALGIRVEAEAGQFGMSTAITSATTAQLDRFVDCAADFSRNQSDDVKSFLTYLEYAVEEDGGLERAPIHFSGNRVEVMTMHKAKGLEWDYVAVPRITDNSFDTSSQSSTWLTRPEKLPPSVSLGGEKEDALDLDISGVENQKEAGGLVAEYKKDMKALDVQESQRVFYVALTRAAKSLLVTCSLRFDTAKGVRKPSADLLAIKDAHERFVDSWCDEDPGQLEEDTDPFAEDAADKHVCWPVDTLGERRPHVEEGARLVLSALGQLKSAAEPLQPIPGDLTELWNTEATMLIDELVRNQSAAIELPAPVSFSASEYQALTTDAAAFARRKARPVPFKPNRFARRGTAFHSWVENRFGVHSLLDDEDLYDIAYEEFIEAESSFNEDELERLKNNFLQSEWADRVPELVEVPFEIGVGNRRIVGRIDAVFKVDGEWMVVDWKTGKKPTGRDLQRAALQLAIYRIAWSDLLRHRGEEVAPEEIRAAFYYVGSQQTVEPDEKILPSRLELDKAMQKLLHETAGQ